MCPEDSTLVLHKGNETRRSVPTKMRSPSFRIYGRLLRAASRVANRYPPRGEGHGLLFLRLELTMEPIKTDLSGRNTLEILDIMVDNRAAWLLLSSGKHYEVKICTRSFLEHEKTNRRNVRSRRSFAGLAN